MIDCLSRGVDDTHLIAAAIARLVRPRDMVVLSGDMGAGKTAFTIGFAYALGVDSEEYVSSPTFNLVQSYTSGRIPIQHADLYRLSSRAEVEDLGLRELADMGSVVVVEWGDVASDVLGMHSLCTLRTTMMPTMNETSPFRCRATDGIHVGINWPLQFAYGV